MAAAKVSFPTKNSRKIKLAPNTFLEEKNGLEFESILTSISSGFGGVLGSHASDADRRRTPAIPALFGRRKCPALQPHTFSGQNVRFSLGSAQIRDCAFSGLRNKLRL